MRNPHFGIWPKDDDDLADKKDKKNVGVSKQIDVPELETIKELRAHRRLFRSKIKAMSDKAFSDFIAGDERAMYEIREMKNKINLINHTIRQLEGK